MQADITIYGRKVYTFSVDTTVKDCESLTLSEEGNHTETLRIFMTLPQMFQLYKKLGEVVGDWSEEPTAVELLNENVIT